jgi:hypothetical protein
LDTFYIAKNKTVPATPKEEMQNLERRGASSFGTFRFYAMLHESRDNGKLVDSHPYLKRKRLPNKIRCACCSEKQNGNLASASGGVSDLGEELFHGAVSGLYYNSFVLGHGRH